VFLFLGRVGTVFGRWLRGVWAVIGGWLGTVARRVGWASWLGMRLGMRLARTRLSWIAAWNLLGTSGIVDHIDQHSL